MRRCIPVLLLAVAACAVLQIQPPALAADWVREEFRDGGSSCSNANCRVKFKNAKGNLDSRDRAKVYKKNEIPGWHESLGEKVGGGILGAVARSAGLQTERTRVGIGVRVINEDGADPWRMTCAIFWISDDEVSRDKEDLSGKVTDSQVRTRGLDCHAAPRSDTLTPRWRYRMGIAPPLERVAATYDSLEKTRSPLVNQYPPMSLEKLSPDGAVSATYDVQRRMTSMTLHRPGGEQFAEMLVRFNTFLDLRSDVQDDERRVARLLVAALRERF